VNRINRILYLLWHLRYLMLYQKFKGYTMTPPVQFIKNMLLASKFNALEGIVVECGVWKGGMIGALVKVMGIDREYHLFDSFEGLPPAKDIDGEAAKKWQSDTTSEWYHDNCSAEEKYAREAMAISGSSTYEIHKGWFSATLPVFINREPIALLRLDGDWYDSTMECLEHLFPKVNEGGLVILDDYNTWEGCTRAVHDFLERNNRSEKVTLFQDSIYYLVKKGK